MNLTEISLFLFNSSHKSIEEAVYKYSQAKVRKVNFRWLIGSAFVFTVMLGTIVGQYRYEKKFEYAQLSYKKAVDDHFKALENRISILKKVVRMEQYHNEMGIK